MSGQTLKSQIPPAEQSSSHDLSSAYQRCRAEIGSGPNIVVSTMPLRASGHEGMYTDFLYILMSFLISFPLHTHALKNKWGKAWSETSCVVIRVDAGRGTT